MQRPDDYETRRQHLAELTDEQLQERFWALTARIVDPLVELSRTHTSPSTERSVLLRMGFSSLEAKAIADQVAAAGLLGRGAGHVVLRLARALGKEYREAGRELAAGLHAGRLPELFRGAGQPGRGGRLL
jgi:D-ornithine 4,5-aminomutase subunit alpha